MADPPPGAQIIPSSCIAGATQLRYNILIYKVFVLGTLRVRCFALTDAESRDWRWREPIARR